MDMDILKEILRRRKMDSAKNLDLMEKESVVIGEKNEEIEKKEVQGTASSDELAPLKREVEPDEEPVSKVKQELEPLPKMFGKKYQVKDGSVEKEDIMSNDDAGLKKKKRSGGFVGRIMSAIDGR